jgi:tetratricopeptide (TPR) repeat protein
VLPRVSIVIRSIARPALANALASVGAQDYPRLETIVVGASGPTHPAPPESVGGHPVCFAASDAALSRPEAANRGLDAAGGDWITFLDDDDVLAPAHVSGLMDATRNAGDAMLVHTLARVRLRDGYTQTLGQPFSTLQLYERNFIHLSMSLFSRDLLALGCRFDESMHMLQDWDFFLQCAQYTRFHFEPRETFEWRADAGTSGAGAGENQDDARFAQYRDRIYAKWSAHHEALVDRVTADLGEVSARAERGDVAGAEAACRHVLTYSQNDPFALNLLAMLNRRAGDYAAARTTQELACSVRPQDPSLVYNLALVCRLQGDPDAARRHCRQALRVDPAFAPARGLLAELGD